MLVQYIYLQPNISVETSDVDFQGLAANAEMKVHILFYQDHPL